MSHELTSCTHFSFRRPNISFPVNEYSDPSFSVACLLSVVPEWNTCYVVILVMVHELPSCTLSAFPLNTNAWHGPGIGHTLLPPTVHYSRSQCLILLYRYDIGNHIQYLSSSNTSTLCPHTIVCVTLPDPIFPPACSQPTSLMCLSYPPNASCTITEQWTHPTLIPVYFNTCLPSTRIFTTRHDYTRCLMSCSLHGHACLLPRS